MYRYFEKFCVQKQVKTPDRFGGFTCTTENGRDFKGLYLVDSSQQIRIAAAQGIKVNGRLITFPDEPIKNGFIVRRVRDNILLKVIGEPKQSPPQAESQIKYFDAEIIAEV